MPWWKKSKKNEKKPMSSRMLVRKVMEVISKDKDHNGVWVDHPDDVSRGSRDSMNSDEVVSCVLSKLTFSKVEDRDSQVTEHLMEVLKKNSSVSLDAELKLSVNPNIRFEELMLLKLLPEANDKGVVEGLTFCNQEIEGLTIGDFLESSNVQLTDQEGMTKRSSCCW